MVAGGVNPGGLTCSHGVTLWVPLYLLPEASHIFLVGLRWDWSFIHQLFNFPDHSCKFCQEQLRIWLLVLLETLWALSKGFFLSGSTFWPRFLGVVLSSVLGSAPPCPSGAHSACPGGAVAVGAAGTAPPWGRMGSDEPRQGHRASFGAGARPGIPSVTAPVTLSFPRDRASALPQEKGSPGGCVSSAPPMCRVRGLPQFPSSLLPLPTRPGFVTSNRVYFSAGLGLRACQSETNKYLVLT